MPEVATSAFLSAYFYPWKYCTFVVGAAAECRYIVHNILQFAEEEKKKKKEEKHILYVETSLQSS